MVADQEGYMLDFPEVASSRTCEKSTLGMVKDWPASQSFSVFPKCSFFLAEKVNEKNYHSTPTWYAVQRIRNERIRKAVWFSKRGTRLLLT